MSYFGGQYHPQYPETQYQPQLGPVPVQYPHSHPYMHSVPNAYPYEHSNVGGFSCQWDWAQSVEASQRLPQPTVHLNPALVHINPKFFPNSGSSIPSSRKVIVNPKFFAVPTKQLEVPSEIPEPEKPEPSPQKKSLIVNKKYSWKKIDPSLQSTPKASPSRLVAYRNSSASSVRKIRRQSSLKGGFKSRYKVDKRASPKSKLVNNNSKTVHTKYKIIRKEGQIGHSTSMRLEKYRLKRRVSVKLPGTLKATPVRCKLFARNKWRPLANTSLTLLSKTPPTRRMGSKPKKKKEINGPAKRYYNMTDVEKQGDSQQPLEEFDVEVTDQPVGLRRREPLGDLPLFITLS